MEVPMFSTTAELQEQLEQNLHLIQQLKDLLRENENQLQTKNKELEECTANFQKFKLQSKAKITQLTSQLKKQSSDNHATSKQEQGCSESVAQEAGTPDHGEQSSKGKVIMLKKQLEESKQRFEKREKEVTQNKKAFEELVKQLQSRLKEQELLIGSLQKEKTEKSESPEKRSGSMPPGEQTKDDKSMQEMYAQMVYKDTKILELNNRILEYEQKIMDLQETVREKDEVLQARNRAIQLMTEDMSRRGKTVIDELDDTRTQMRLMQQTFVSQESDWKKVESDLEAKLQESKEKFSSELDEKEKKIAQLEENLNKMETVRFDLAAKNAKLQEKIVLLQESAEQWKETQVKAFERETENLKTQLANKEKEVEELRKTLDETINQSDNKILKARAKERSKAKALERELEALKKGKENQGQLTELQQRIAELEEEKGKADKERESLQTSLAKKLEEVEKLHGEIRSLEQQRSDSKSSSDDTDTEKMDSSAEVLKFREEIGRLNEQIQTLKVELELEKEVKASQEQRLAEYEEYKCQSEAKITHLSKESKTYENRVIELETSLKKTEQEKVTLEMRLIELEEQKDLTDRRVEALMSELHVERDKSTSALKELESLEGELSKIKEEYEVEKEKSEGSSLKLKELSDSLIDFETVSSEKDIAIETATREKLELKEQIDCLSKELHARKDELSKLQNELDRVGNALSTKEKDFVDLSSKFEALQTQVQDIMTKHGLKDFTEIETRWADFEENSKHLKEALNVAKEKNRELESQLQSLKLEAVDARSSWESKEQELVERMNHITGENESLKGILRDFETNIKQLRHDLTQQEEEKMLLLNALKEKQVLISQLELEVKQTKRELSLIKENHSEEGKKLELKLSSLLGQISDLEVEVSHLRQALDQSGERECSLKKDVEKLLIDNEQLSQQLSLRESELSTEIKKKEESIISLKARLEAASSQLEQNRQEHEKNIIELKDSLEASIALLRDEHETLLRGKVEELDALQVKLKELEHELIVKNKELDQTREALAERDVLLSSVNEELSTKSIALTQMSDVVNTLTLEENALKQQLMERASEIVKKEEGEQNLREQVQQLTESLTVKERCLEKEMRTSETVRQEKQELIQRINDLSQEKNEVEEDLQELRSDMELLRTSHEEVCSQLAKLQETVKRYQQESYDKDARCEELLSKMLEKEKDIAEGTKSRDELSYQVQALQGKLTEMTEKVVSLEAHTNQQEGKLKEYYKRLDAKDKIIAEMESEKVLLQGSADEREKSVLDKLEEVKQARDKFKEEVVDLQLVLEVKEKELKISVQETGNLQHRISELEEKNMEAQCHLKELSETISALQNLSETYGSKNGLLEGKIKELEQTLRETSEQNSELSETVENLKKRLEASTERESSLMDNLSQKEKELLEKQNKIISLEQQLEDVKMKQLTQIENLTHELQTIQEHNLKLENSVTKSTFSQEQIMSQLSDEKRRCESLEEKKTELEKLIQDMTQQSQGISLSLEASNSEVGQLQEQLKMLQIDFANLQNNAELQKTQWMEQIRSLEDAKLTLHDEVQRRSQEIEDLQKLHQQHLEELTNYQSKIQEYENAVRALGQKMISKDEQIASFHEQQTSDAIRLQELDARYQEELLKVDSLRQSLEDTKSIKDKLEDEKEKLLLYVKEMEKDLEMLSRDLESEQERSLLLREQHVGFQTTVDNLQSTCNELSNEVRILHGKLDENEMLVTNLRSNLELMLKERTEMEEKLSEYINKAKDFENTISMLRDSLKIAEEHKLDGEEAIKSLEAKITEINAEREDILAKIANLEKELKETKEGNEQLNIALKSRENELSQALQQLRILQSDSSEQVQKLSSRLQAAQSENQTYSDQINFLQNHVKELEAQFHEAQKKSEELEEQIKTMNEEHDSKISTLEKDSYQLREENKQLNETLETHKIDLQQAMQQIVSLQSDSTENSQKLSSELDVARLEIHSHVTQIAALQNQAQDLEKQLLDAQEKSEQSAVNVKELEKLSEKLKLEKDESVSKINMLEKIVEELREENGQLSESLKSHKTELQQAVQQIKLLESNSSEHVEKLSRELRAAHSEIQNYITEVNTFQNHIRELENQLKMTIEHSHSREAELSEQLKFLQMEHNTQTTNYETLLSASLKKDSLIAELEDKVKSIPDLEKTIGEQTTVISSNSEENARLKQEISEQTQQLQQLSTVSQHLSIKEKELEELNMVVEELQKNQDRIIQERCSYLQSQFEILEQRFKAKDNEIQELRLENQTLHSDISGISSSVKDNEFLIGKIQTLDQKIVSLLKENQELVNSRSHYEQQMNALLDEKERLLLASNQERDQFRKSYENCMHLVTVTQNEIEEISKKFSPNVPSSLVDKPVNGKVEEMLNYVISLVRNNSEVFENEYLGLKSKVRRLEEQEAELEQAKILVKNTQHEVMLLRQENQFKNLQLKKMQKQLESLQEKERDFAGMQSQNETLEEMIQKLESEKKSLTEENSAIKQQLQQLDSEQSKHQEHHIVARAVAEPQVMVIKERVQGSESVFPLPSDETKQLSIQEVEDIKHQAEVNRIKLEKMFAKLKMFKEKNESLQKELKQLTTTKKELEATVNTLKTENTELKNQCSNQSTVIDCLNHDFQNREKIYADNENKLNQDIQLLKDNNQYLRTEVDRSAAEIEGVKSTQRELENNYSSICETKSTVEKQLCQKNQEYLEKCTALQFDNESLKRELETMKEHVEMLSSDNEMYQNVIDNLKRSKLTLEQEVKKQHEQWRHEVKIYETRQQENANKITQLESALRDHKSIIQELKNSHQSLKDQYNNIFETHSLMRQRLESITAQELIPPDVIKMLLTIAHSELDSKEITGDRENEGNTTTSTNSLIHEYKSKVDHLMREKQQLVETVTLLQSTQKDEAQTEGKQKVRDSLLRLESEIGQLKNANTALQNELSLHRHESSIMAERHEKEKRSLEFEITKLNEQLTEASRHCHMLTEEFNSKQNQFKEYVTKVHQENVSLQQTVDRLRADLLETTNHGSKLASENEQLVRAYNVLRDEKGLLEQQIENWKKHLGSVSMPESEDHSTHKRIVNVESELEQATVALHQQNLRCEELTLEISKLLDEQDHLNHQLRVSQHALSQLEKQVSSLQKQLHNKTNDNQQRMPSPGAIQQSPSVIEERKQGSSTLSGYVDVSHLKAEISLLRQRLEDSERTCSDIQKVNASLDQALIVERQRRQLLEEELNRAHEHLILDADSPKREECQLLLEQGSPQMILQTNYSITRSMKSHAYKLRQWFRGRRNYCYRTIKRKNMPQLLFYFYFFLVHIWLLACVF